MNKFILGAAIAAVATITPVALQAQQLPPAVVAVVDVASILQRCTACVAANTALQQQEQQIQARATQLGTPLQTEAQAIQAALTAARNNPDAALQQRITTFRSQQEAAQREITGRQETLQRNRQFVLQQIGQRLNPIVTQVAQQRGASVAIDAGQTIWNQPQLEITEAVLALINTQLPSVQTVAPPPAQQPAAQPPAAQPQPNRPRPQGR